MFFFSFGYIRDEYYLQLVNVIGSGKSASDKLMLNVAVLILYLYI